MHDINIFFLSFFFYLCQIHTLTKEKAAASSSLRNPYNQYGAGAESKMRLDEFNVNNNNQTNASLRAVPIPEGRMRIHEQSRYATSLEANIARVPEPNKRDRSPKYPSNSSLKTQSNESVKPVAAEIKSKNPFDEDDAVEVYDDSKNPFADDVDGASAVEAKDIEAVENGKKLNPFEEYDNNLNPFA